ncbi:hypothetical protein COCSADRAFT_35021 [Bipolaris sorokiniana ND90Pr]|uniref:Uncharacterized protein n=1 Tax=Cochliobolus sativus (strain ND90Pr / ATCC 201652) TaxID=665912 RepID=M2SW39_COCSN|nr:uncharacterized protein COCSADRAFT_35021 [Bipolaris sorokiniana ND90Pr]EMD66510.1 hypothetical protein COCSADRAFT_35021 [Bipolaris sorokiniana ND90Pr]
MDFNNPNAYGGQFANSPQHAQFDPQARLQQQPNAPGQYAQHAPFAGMGGAMGNSVMPSGAPYLQQRAALQPQPQQQPQQQQHQLSSPSPYSSAPFAQPMPSPAHQQQFAQNRQTASPASVTGQPPFAIPQPQPSPGSLPTNGHQTPMNLQLPIKSEPPQLQTPVKAVPPSPMSPSNPARSQDRVATLLEINSILIKEVCDLQAQGKAGHVGPTPEGKPEGEKAQPSKEYVDYMRRLQANLAYLAQNAEKVPKPGQQMQPGPAIMSVPPSHVDLAKLYTKLQELFPGWKGQSAQMKQSPGPQRVASNPGPQQLQQQQQQQPPNSAGLHQNWGPGVMQQSLQLAQQQAQQQQPPT